MAASLAPLVMSTSVTASRQTVLVIRGRCPDARIDGDLAVVLCDRGLCTEYDFGRSVQTVRARFAS